MDNTGPFLIAIMIGGAVAYRTHSALAGLMSAIVSGVLYWKYTTRQR